MVYHYRCITFLAATTMGLVLARDAEIAPEIRDEGKFFGAAAIQKANTTIRDIYVNHDRDVLIETFPTVPAADIDKVKPMDAQQRSAYFLQWAKERAKERAVNGVYVLICKEPRHLQVGVVETKTPHKFPSGTRDAIESTLVRAFKDGQFDDGLEDSLRLINDKLTKK